MKPSRLTEAFAQDTTPGMLERGRELHRSNRVLALEGRGDRVTALVRGRRNYDVEIHLRAGDTTARCDCPWFESVGLCKHIFAVLLGAEERGLLADADPAPERPSRWGEVLGAIRRVQSGEEGAPPALPAAREQALYVIGLAETLGTGRPLVQLLRRRRGRDGSWGRPRPASIREVGAIGGAHAGADREVLAVLQGAAAGFDYDRGFTGSRLQPSTPLLRVLVPLLAKTGRLFLADRLDGAESSLSEPFAWDDGPPWEFRFELVRAKTRGRGRVARGFLARGDERMEIEEPALLISGGFVFAHGTVARLDDSGAFSWISVLRRSGPQRIPARDLDLFLARFLRMPGGPPFDLPEELGVREVDDPPRPRLTITRPPEAWGRDRLLAEVSFEYLEEVLPANAPGRGVYRKSPRRVAWRQPGAERAALDRLEELGLRPEDRHDSAASRLSMPARRLPAVVRDLVSEGWYVEAEGRVYRAAGGFHVSVRSGIDWFELHGDLEFGGDVAAKLPALLTALRKRKSTVVLDDGSVGVLPEDWLENWGFLAGVGVGEKDHLRFLPSQTALLDALLAARPEADFDETFRRAREELARFESLEPADPPPGFTGTLRGYQREGLGWLHLLRRFRLSGCLADDMGLGKTVQVLALLAARREERERAGADGGPRASLVVAPKSLVFNWREEAARFTPGLRILEHAGAGRARDLSAFDDFDLVLTTYGTLRRDAPFLKDHLFDYVVLDESQAIKNAGTATAKAARLLEGRHRLALSGTPIENHLGELWSLVEFLNPGMLGSAPVFRESYGGNGGDDDDSRAVLARALRPILLRRTKSEVLPELPPRTELTIWCDLDERQRRQYAELRDHYRATLLGRIDADGLARSRMHVLEALLRLRQAACHPGLIDPARAGESCAKLRELLPRLEELVDAGHKVLVFSQFTSLLAIVREKLDAEGPAYAYLDGRTRNRAAAVERFQEDPDCPLFLISLKAGGLGLNLTAADYAFLLDPWWNPAVEAQAIDRTHRIGQTRRVFAYRLIARDTVEEKVIALQETKRDLADAILGADRGLIRKLTREDLELLLGE